MDATDRPGLIERDALARMLAVLQDDGYQLVGPTVHDHAIVTRPVKGLDEFPIGWTDEQEAGTYRLRRRDDEAVFGFTAGPDSWKGQLFPSRERLCTVALTHEGFRVDAEPIAAPPRAFIGVRSCDLAAIAVQDRVFTEGSSVDPRYAARRAAVFIVAVQCVEAGRTCFCASMGTGPTAGPGHDLALTELLDPDHHAFLVEVGTPAGRAVLDRVPHRPATPDEIALARQRVAAAADSMGRRLDTAGLRERLAANPEHPHWDDVAERCLACANCTMVCPTCFCSTIRDTSDLTGDHAERWREWESCFTEQFTELHGHAVRSSIRSRYRQWLTHKLSTWFDQFGESGCTGCGRCITWCPVGIDLTQEAERLRWPAAHHPGAAEPART